jgi:hypothetical protein
MNKRQLFQNLRQLPFMPALDKQILCASLISEELPINSNQLKSILLRFKQCYGKNVLGEYDLKGGDIYNDHHIRTIKSYDYLINNIKNNKNSKNSKKY